MFLLATVTFSRKADTGKSVSKRRRFEQVVEAVEEEYGLNDPLIEQYLSYMGNLLKGDLGDFLSGSGYIGGRDYRTGSSAYGVMISVGSDQ